eukprot:3333733-Alexandrium_andersonii.AAC.1
MDPSGASGTNFEAFRGHAQFKLGARNPAWGGQGPSAPNGRNGLFRGSELANVGDPFSAGPDPGSA